MNDHALDALLAEYVAPPVPAGLAGRAAAAALALPQEPRLAFARRAGPVRRRDRRGKWLRRPMLLGGLVLGLAVSGAVAATLAGMRLDWPAAVEALADMPFLGRETPPDPPAPPHAAAPPQAPPAVEPAPAPDGQVATPRKEEPPAPPAAAIRDDPPPAAVPNRTPQRSDMAGPRLIEARPAARTSVPTAESERPAPPAPITADREGTSSIPSLEPRAPAPGADEEARERLDRIERAERLRTARQAQIERLQRIQQRRERIRRLRRE